MKVVVWRLRSILLLPLHQLISVSCQFTEAVGRLMLEPFFFADFRMLSDNIQRQVLVISNAKIRSQFQRSVFGRKSEKAAGEADDITIRLTSKAMKAFVRLHTGCPVIVKWASAHAAPANMNAVVLGSFSRGYAAFYGFKQIHRSPRFAKKMTFPLIVPRPDEASPAALLQLFCQYPVLHSALPGVRSWFLVHPLEETACRLPL